MGLNKTPSANRVHIGFFGKRNVGKSSVVNAVTDQEVAVVSDVKGTTTDPVYKSMELLPMGPVVIIDTPGIDDEGTLGDLRVRKTKQVLNKTDVAVLIVHATFGKTEVDDELIRLFVEKKINYIVVYNKSDLLAEELNIKENEIFVSATKKTNIKELKEKISSLAITDEPKLKIVGDIINASDFVVLVTPIDKAAPKGRLILPQQQTIRDILEADATAIVVKEFELRETLENLGKKPKIVITDSQVFAKVSADTPNDIMLTSFSILFARYKGLLDVAVKGTAELNKLNDGDTVLISEGCTHHRQCDDIGSVKLPRWIKNYTGKQLNFEFSSGTEFPDELQKYDLIVHCGGCMLNDREVKYRQKCAMDQSVPITNYGIIIAYMQGILKRSLQAFPHILMEIEERKMRTEKDNIGEIKLEDKALYGIQSVRAKKNFALDYKKTDLWLIYAIVKVKKASALTYNKLGIGKNDVYSAIAEACDIILTGNEDDQFIVDALQGGAGTSTNMNVNEVIANIALKILGKSYGEYDVIHPLDDVNRGQSTNDVYPTALRIAAIGLLRDLSDGCAKLQEALQHKENEFDDIKKLGRTELMDAVPITLGAEFGAYAQAIARDRWRLYKVEERLRQVNIGGTAVGMSHNADRKYRFGMIEELRNLTGFGLAVAEYPIDITQNNDVFVEVSGLIKALSVNLMKISNDLRFMNSGPNGGLGEIRLAPMQTGSTIMPGKVNPVIPEMIMQVAMKVMANDYAITTAAAHGEFELNAFLPLIADSLLQSLSLLERAVTVFRTKCVDLIEPNHEKCEELLNDSYAFALNYTSYLGYDTVSKIINENDGDIEKIKDILDRSIKSKL